MDTETSLAVGRLKGPRETTGDGPPRLAWLDATLHLWLELEDFGGGPFLLLQEQPRQSVLVAYRPFPPGQPKGPEAEDKGGRPEKIGGLVNVCLGGRFGEWPTRTRCVQMGHQRGRQGGGEWKHPPGLRATWLRPWTALWRGAQGCCLPPPSWPRSGRQRCVGKAHDTRPLEGERRHGVTKESCGPAASPGVPLTHPPFL